MEDRSKKAGLNNVSSDEAGSNEARSNETGSNKAGSNKAGSGTTARLLLLAGMAVLAGCGATPMATKAVAPARRAYNGTASVGDFFTISVDASALTITYKDYTNGEAATVPYTVNGDDTYTIADPEGNLVTAYEVPGTALMVEAEDAGPNRDTAALITAIESTPATINTFAGRNFNYMQFRTASGGLEIGTISIDAQANITHSGYWPFGALAQPPNQFGGGSFAAASVQEDASGNFFTITESNSSQDYVFGTQNGFFAVDTGNGTILSLPKAASRNFLPANAGTYTALFYEKLNAQTGQNDVESGTAVEGKATVTVTASGGVTIADSRNNTLAGGTLAAIADTSYIYDGTTNQVSDPCYGMFTFRTSGNSQQDVFVSFQGNAVIFSSFTTALPLQNYGTYSYFYGVGLK